MPSHYGSVPEIHTPRGSIITTESGDVELTWNRDFKIQWTGRYVKAQKFVDSEILRLSEPYIPLRTGHLLKTGLLGTIIGSGLVAWIAPYASSVYYLARKIGSSTGPLRGPMWFERMKKLNKHRIVAGARERMRR